MTKTVLFKHASLVYLRGDIMRTYNECLKSNNWNIYFRRLPEDINRFLFIYKIHIKHDIKESGCIVL